MRAFSRVIAIERIFTTITSAIDAATAKRADLKSRDFFGDSFPHQVSQAHARPRTLQSRSCVLKLNGDAEKLSA